MNKHYNSYPCDVEHSSQLMENILDVFGIHVQDGKLSSHWQTPISNDREDLYSLLHISVPYSVVISNMHKRN